MFQGFIGLVYGSKRPYGKIKYGIYIGLYTSADPMSFTCPLLKEFFLSFYGIYTINYRTIQYGTVWHGTVPCFRV